MQLFHGSLSIHLYVLYGALNKMCFDIFMQVILIVEILIRKCGFDAIDLVTPEKYKEFVRSVEEVRFP